MERRGDCDLGPAHSASFQQPGMLSRQVVLAVHPADRAGGLDQHRGQPLVAVPFAGRCLASGGLVHPRPNRPRQPGERRSNRTCRHRFRR